MTRALTAAAVALAVATAALVMFEGSRGDYRVHARFEHASQLVKGNAVQVAGVPVGSVESIELTDDGRADVTLRIDDDRYSPLRRGTTAVVRQTSLAGVANRYVDLRLPASGGAIADGGLIDVEDTVSAVELDQIFNVFDPDTRAALSSLIKGSGAALAGRGDEASAALLYLNPALASSQRLAAELTRDRPELRRFLREAAALAGDVAARGNDLAELVDSLAVTTAAIGRRDAELARAIRELPDFLRSSNTTFVNLRATLDDLDPLVAEAKPLARELRPFSGELRRLAAAARPALAELEPLVRSRGADNDLVDALRRLPDLRDQATRPTEADGEERPATLETTARALEGFTPELAYIRPYGVDATGWFDDFAHTGVVDALGGTGRIAFHFGAYANLGGALTFVPPELRDALFGQVAVRDQRNRCPGALERGTAYKPTPGHNCDLTQVPPGP